MAIDLDQKLDTPRGILQAYIDEAQLTIPVLPAVAIEMLRLYKDPDTNTRAMADLIQKDQSLVGSVIRVCNSAAFGGVRPITSLQLAIARLGIRVLGRIAVSHIVRGKVFSAHAHEQEMAAIWKHAQLAALLASELAGSCGVDNEEVFLCGLLHSVGKPTVYQAIEELKSKRAIDVTTAMESALAEEFHCRVGFQVTEAWTLPLIVRWSCLYYETPAEAPPEASRIIAVVHLATRLSRAFLHNDSPDTLLESPTLATLGLAPDRLQKLIDNAEALIQKAEDMGR
jgi:HD-like signal output (HDOD) protein